MQKNRKRIISFIGALLMTVSSLGAGSSLDAGDVVLADQLTATEESMLEGGESVLAEEEVLAKGKIQYIPQTQPQGVVVAAYAEEGVLPEGVTLHAEIYEEQSVKYQEAGKELEDNAVAHEGFMAMDIGFYDAQGNEIEPEEGTVEVEIMLGSHLLPEEVARETLAVQHHQKTDTGIQVKTVADVTEVARFVRRTTGEVNIENEIIRAEFIVDSFSTFTITWGSGSTSRVAIIHYVDQNGLPIQGRQTSNVSLGGSTAVTLATAYAGVIPGYTYRGAYLYNVHGLEIQRLRRSNNSLQYSTSNTGISWTAISNNSNVYLVYENQNTEPEEPKIEHTREASYEKYVEEKADGTYDLSLTISGAAGSIHEKAKLDILYVLDVSGSMAWDMNANRGNSNARRNAAAQAIANFTTSIVDREDIDPQFALVTFSASTSGRWNAARTVAEWTGNSGQIITASATASPNGGTNYQAGIMQASDEIALARADAAKAVIFISDGDPTSFYNADGTPAGGGSVFNPTALERGITAAEQLNTDYFFTVGVGIASNYQRLRQLNGAVETTPSYVSGGSVANNYFEGHNETALRQAFDTIMENVTDILCTNVTITDTLSENVYITNPSQLVISVVDEGGNEVATGNNTLTLNGVTIQANYDPDSREVTLEFPPNYKLEDGYTYKITVNIAATEEAYEKYRSTGGQYTNKGDAGTGISSEDILGFHTNENAVVTYHYNGEEVVSTYPHPVIQLNAGTLTIRKKITGLSETALAELMDTLNFAYEVENTQFLGGNAFLEEFRTPKDGDGEYYTYVIGGLSPGTTYKISEIGANVEGYDLQTTVTGDIEGTIVGGETSVVTFANAYTLNTFDLEVTKRDDTSGILDGATFKLESEALEEPLILEGTQGVFLFEELPPGTYMLTEIKAPDGYVILAEPVTIVITNAGAVTIDSVAYDVDENRFITLDIINNKIYELPSAGGIGTYLFTISGVAIMVIAILLFINERRKEGGNNYWQ